MTNAQARLRPQRRRGWMPQHLRKQDNAMTQIDRLLEVAKKLKEARILGESCSDRALLYFIDMTIVHVCDSLGSEPETQGAAESHVSRLHAAH
jgi:hypothetical protein